MIPKFKVVKKPDGLDFKFDFEIDKRFNQVIALDIYNNFYSQNRREAPSLEGIKKQVKETLKEMVKNGMLIKQDNQWQYCHK